MQTFREFLRLEIRVYLGLRSLKNNLLNWVKSQQTQFGRSGRNIENLKAIITASYYRIKNSEIEFVNLFLNGYRQINKAWIDAIHLYLARKNKKTANSSAGRLKEFVDDPVRMQLLQAEFEKQNIFEQEQAWNEEKKFRKQVKVYVGLIVLLLVIIHIIITY